MQRLIDNKLIYGQLLEVAEPHLVERYNKALKALSGRTTGLKRFRIDMAGFSPEVAIDLKDEAYLDPNGVNRRFIILSPEQIDLPVINTAFSNTEDLLYNFFEKNSRAILALTIKDVLFGEIEDSVFEVREIEDLLAIEQVEFRVSTTTDLIGKSGELRLLIDRLQKEPEAWRDDAMLTKMVEIARVTGDIATNELMPNEVVFRQSTFWTSHFGGAFVFIDAKQTTVIADPAARGFRKSRPWTVAYIDRDDHAQVYKFLAETGRLDPPRGSWIERSGLLDERALMLAVWLAVKKNPKTDLSQVGPQWFAAWNAANARTAEEDGGLPLIAFVKRHVADWANVDIADIPAQKRFLISRANPEHPDRHIVNRLISQYLPFDFMTRFVFNKPGFYRDYEAWPENYRAYVVNRIRDTYLADKKALRRRLYK
jgi:hypothetical protein